MSPKEMSAQIRAKKKASIKTEHKPLPVNATLDTASNLETPEALDGKDMGPSDSEKTRMGRLRSKLASMKMTS